MIWNWRTWLLTLLMVGPILAYMGFGAAFLWQRGWLLPAGVGWLASGIVFSVLAARWTKNSRELLPPIDWDSPSTFSPFDRKAWELVQHVAEQVDTLPIERLNDFDIYVNTGRDLAQRLAAHYQPLATDPIEHVPIVELLTALELAAEDLNRLCLQVPGGDLITPAHYKQAIKAAGYLQRANDLYGYLLPLFNPVTGLVRLGTQHLMVKPAWKNMQQNLQRWFFRAFVNRLGTHLIELYSGRLVIGSHRYRKLTRGAEQATAVVDEELGPLQVAVAGARRSAWNALREELESADAADLDAVRVRLLATGHVESAVDRLRSIRWVATPGYTGFETPLVETARDRATRKETVAAAVEADMLVLVIDARGVQEPDLAFARDWNAWYRDHPTLELPPALIVVGGMTDEVSGPVATTGDGSRLDPLREALGSTLIEVADLRGTADDPVGQTLAVLATLLRRAERTALIRQLHRASRRSKARRLVNQVARQGRDLWSSLRSRGATASARSGKDE